MSSDYADDSFSMETDQEYQEREIHIFERAKLDKNDFKLLQQNGDATMHEDYLDAVKQISLFLNSKVSLAEKNLQAKYGKTLVHTHCTAVMALLKGLMTMDETDLDFAMDAMRNAIEAASYLRKDQSIISSFSGMFFGTSKTSKFDHLKSLTLLQKHAELVYAEAYFLKALLSLITESNMVTFVKEGLAIRQAYSMYKVFYKFLNHIMQNEGPEGLLKHGIDNRFVTGVYLGIGGFNLMLSILPEKVLRIFEFIGFSGNRKFGMQCLALGANWELDPNSPIIQKRVKTKSATNFYSDIIPVETGPGSRKFICDIILSLYHVLLSTMVQLPGCDVPTASKVIQGNLEKNPDSFLYLIFKGKVSQANRQIKDAINEFTLVTEKQIDWRQLSHVCFWDIGVCYAAIGDWNKAAEYFDILYQENRWSKSIYLYMKAIFLYTADPVKNKVQVAEMLQEVPNHLKKVAGKSIPLEVIGY
jgi:tetratricopeptide (TPR) repeat protein